MVGPSQLRVRVPGKVDSDSSPRPKVVVVPKGMGVLLPFRPMGDSPSKRGLKNGKFLLKVTCNTLGIHPVILSG